MNNLYEQYALLATTMAKLEAEKEELTLRIIEDMKSRGSTSEAHSLGKFSYVPLKRWTYPERITKLDEEVKKKVAELNDTVKAEKAKAESTGEATYVEKDSLRFTENKL